MLLNSIMQSKLIRRWIRDTLGDEGVTKEERALRFFEETCETMQSVDIDPVVLQKILERTYSRPKDTPFREVGGVMVTLLAFCDAAGVDLEGALNVEVNRVLSKPKSHWQGKYQQKIEDGVSVVSEIKP